MGAQELASEPTRSNQGCLAVEVTSGRYESPAGVKIIPGSAIDSTPEHFPLRISGHLWHSSMGGP